MAIYLIAFVYQFYNAVNHIPSTQFLKYCSHHLSLNEVWRFLHMIYILANNALKEKQWIKYSLQNPTEGQIQTKPENHQILRLTVAKYSKEKAWRWQKSKKQIKSCWGNKNTISFFQIWMLSLSHLILFLSYILLVLD